MNRFNKISFKQWFTSLSPNVKFASGAAILSRFVADTGAKWPSGNVPQWVSRVSKLRGPNYDTIRVNDRSRAKKHFFADAIKAI